MSDSQNSLSIIIRSSGERTTELCKALLEQQAPGTKISVLNVAPFEESLRQACDIGTSADKKWTLMVDADILLRPGAVRQLISIGDKAPAKTFQINGLVYDKFLLMARSGVRLYKTAILPELKKIVPAEGQQIRPESHARRLLEKQGWVSVRTTFVAGIHDFDQYYRDIYRKSLLHGHKNFSAAADCLHIWNDNKAADPDFAVAIKGFAQGVINPAPPKLDSRTFDSAEPVLKKLGLREKEPIPTTEEHVKSYESRIEEMLVERFPTRCQRYSILCRKRGVLCALINSFGGTFNHIGRAICALGDWTGRSNS